MTTEEVKNFLKGYQRAKERFRQLLERIAELESIITSISVDYSAERVQTSPPDPSDQIAKLSDMRTEKIEAANEMSKRMDEVCKVIDKVGGVQGEILHRRYIEGQRWEEIAVNMHYNYRTVTKLHGKALLVIADMLKDAPQCPIDMW